MSVQNIGENPNKSASYSSSFGSITKPRNHDKFLEDQQTHEYLRIQRHRDVVERTLESENATFVP